MQQDLGMQVFTKEKVKIGLLDIDKADDLRLEKSKNGDMKLIFRYPIKNTLEELELEGYLKTKEQEYVIQQRNKRKKYYEIYAYLNLEELEGKPWDRFETVEQTIKDSLTLAIAGTGYVIGSCDVTKKRTIRLTNTSSLDIINEAIKTYRCFIEYDTINKKINIYENIGSDKGVYFHNELNLIDLSSQDSTLEYFTRLIPYGKDGLTIESITGGKNYLENYQYSKKVKTQIWKDERYTIVENLKEDAGYKLSELSKPYKAYQVSIRDLAKKYQEYSFLSYGIGDIVTIIDIESKTKDKQKVIKIVEYLKDASKNTVELANTYLDFAEIQQEYQSVADTVNNITSDNGTISEAAIKNVVDKLTANKIDVNSFNAVTARIGALEVTTVKATEFIAYKANIDNLFAKKADIDVLNAGIERVVILEGKVADIKTILAGHITVDMLEANTIKAGSGVIADGAIGNAQISSLDVNKLNAGTIDTTKISLAGANSRLVLKGNRLQIFGQKSDSTLFEKIVIGDIDNNGTKFGIRVRADDGKTGLFDENGFTKEGFTDGYNKLDNDSLDPSKIDIAKVVTRINNGTTTIQSSKILMNNTSLDVQFKTLSDNVSNIQVGGRNLVLNGGFETGDLSGGWQFSEWRNAGNTKLRMLTLSENADVIGNYTPNIHVKESNEALVCGGMLRTTTYIKVKPNSKYTLSYYRQVQNCSVSHEHNFIDNNGKNLGAILLYGTTTVEDEANRLRKGNAVDYVNGYDGTWKKVVVHFIPPNNCTQVELRFVLGNSNGGNNCDFVVDNIKMEEGTVATAWTPAPEDLQAQIDTHTTEITANEKAIGLKLDTQIYTSKMIALDGSLSTFQDNLKKTTSSITALQESITSKVSMFDVTDVLYKQNIALSFKDVVNGIFDGNNFTKNTGGIAWNSGFASINTLSNGEYVEFTVAKLSTHVMVGLSTTNKDANYNTIDYAIYQTYQTANNVTTQMVQVYEKGVIKGTFGNIEIGDKLRVSIESNKILYYKNGELFYTSLIAPTLPMIIDASFYEQSSGIRNIRIGTTLSGITTRITSAESSITQLKDSIKLKVEKTDITNAINNITIGGRNLIRNSAFTESYNFWISNGFSYIEFDGLIFNKHKTMVIHSVSSGFDGTRSTYDIPYKNNTNYTVSLWVYRDSTSSWGDLVRPFRVYFPEYNGSTLIDYRNYITITSANLPDKTWTKFTATFKTSSVGTKFSAMCLDFASGTGKTAIWVADIKFEEGIVATAWTPSLEDNQSEIDDTKSKVNTVYSQLQIDSDGISQVVSKITKDTSNNTTRLNSLEQSITASAITTTITSGIDNGTASIKTTQFVMDNDGLTIKNGAFNILNRKGVNIFNVDYSGNINTRGNFYNYDYNNVLRASLTNKKLNIYNETGGYIGGLGSNEYLNDSNIKGLTLDLDMAGKYISFAVRSSSSSSTYDTVLSYHRAGSFEAEGLNAGASLNMNNWNINNTGNLIESNYIRAMNYISNGKYVQVVVNRTQSAQFLKGITVWDSDGRLKKNIDISNVSGIDEVMKFKHRSFDWKETNIHQEIGYIAQEMESINSNYVLKVRQPNGIDTYQIKPENIIPVLSKAIQELKKENDYMRILIEDLYNYLKLQKKEQVLDVDLKEVIQQYEECIFRDVIENPKPEKLQYKFIHK
ncbi:phage tail spike protein [Clostridium sp. HBUAS56017]|uniref:phage tail spike protein n=1 Tax=Clostridium sp. HBUAS56017 TaxID=2571128 RepID=UPI001177F633|nr:phage tail spike protein [Clostridium sp. HBUAS56017]